MTQATFVFGNQKGQFENFLWETETFSMENGTIIEKKIQSAIVSSQSASQRNAAGKTRGA